MLIHIGAFSWGFAPNPTLTLFALMLEYVLQFMNRYLNFVKLLSAPVVDMPKILLTLLQKYVKKGRYQFIKQMLN